MLTLFVYFVGGATLKESGLRYYWNQRGVPFVLDAQHLIRDFLNPLWFHVQQVGGFLDGFLLVN
jgi:hypothetical protein